MSIVETGRVENLLTFVAHHAVGTEAALEAALVALGGAVVRDSLARLLAGGAASPVLAPVLTHHRCKHQPCSEPVPSCQQTRCSDCDFFHDNVFHTLWLLRTKQNERA